MASMAAQRRATPQVTPAATHGAHGGSNTIPAALTFATAAGMLTTDALIHEHSRLDIWAINQVQRFDAPHLEDAITVVSTLTSSTWAIALWALTVVVLVAARWWVAAAAAMTLPFGGLLNHIIGEYVVGRTRPDPDLVTRTVPDIHAASFPSGHVMGAVMLYGLIFVVAGRIRNRVARIALRSVMVTIIASVGFARVWEGAHWPTDVLGAYAFGGFLLVLLAAVYHRVDSAVGRLPLVRAGEVPHDETRAHAHALTSTVRFDDETVTKIYNPGIMPRALYWLAFQAAFPYERNRAAALAAQERRNLAAMLTEYWYGAPRVARLVTVTNEGDRLGLVSERIDGVEPRDEHAARSFLRDLRSRFDDAGLPTWQIDPRQPRAVDNLLETPDGRYMIVDLESGLVSPLASRVAWRRAFGARQTPMFDTVFFDVTRGYVAAEAETIRERLGDDWLAQLESRVDAAERAAAGWYATEPRLWTVLLSPREWRPRLTAFAARGQERASEWLTAAIDRWVDEGRIDDTEAASLRSEIETPRFQAVVPHLGAHLAITVALRFPLGSIARVAWTSWALGSATVRLAMRRIDRHAWRQALSVHNPLVIVLAAIPGFGALAYVASGPVRSNRLLLRVVLDAALSKLPWRLYERTGAQRLVTAGHHRRQIVIAARPPRQATAAAA